MRDLRQGTCWTKEDGSDHGTKKNKVQKVEVKRSLFKLHDDDDGGKYIRIF